MKNKKTLGVIAGLAAVVVIMVVVVFNRKTTIDLTKYISVVFKGYDSIGTAEVTFNYYAFYEEYKDKIKLNEKAYREFYSGFSYDKVTRMIENMDVAGEMLEKCVYGELNQVAVLSNGDTINYTWACDTELAMELFGCKLKFSDMTFTVEGLDEIQYFDAFEVLDVAYTGIEPYGMVELNVNATADEYDYIKYKVDKNEKLNNGDQIVVSIEIINGETVFASTYGKLPVELQKTYTVSGLPKYIESSSEITDELFAQMKAEAENIIESQVVSDFKKTGSVDNMTYLGNYFFTKKAGDFKEINMCYLVYQVDFTEEFTAKKNNRNKNAIDAVCKETIYTFVAFNNIRTDTDGKLVVDLSDCKTATNELAIETEYVQYDLMKDNIRYYSLHHRGYLDMGDLYNGCVAVNKGAYAIEENVMK